MVSGIEIMIIKGFLRDLNWIVNIKKMIVSVRLNVVYSVLFLVIYWWVLFM